MSINITVHGSPSKRYSKTQMLLDPEGNRKKILEERRKLRLEQVRLKSKDLASQVRKRVESEKQKQLKRIQETKREELKTWKRTLKNQLNNVIPGIGEAHRAAERELANSSSVFHNIHKKESFDLIPAVPNKSKRKTKSVYNAENKENVQGLNSNLSTEKPMRLVTDKSLTEKLTKSRNLTDENIPIKYHKKIDTIQTEKYIEDDDSKEPVQKQYDRKSSHSYKNPSNMNRYVPPKLNSYASFKDRQKKLPGEHLRKTPSLIMSVGSSDVSFSSSTSSLEIHDVHDQTNQHFSRIYSKSRKSSKPDLREKNYKANNLTENQEPTIEPRKPKFTQISDFINKQQSSRSDSIKSVNEIERQHMQPQNEIRYEESKLISNKINDESSGGRYKVLSIHSTNTDSNSNLESVRLQSDENKEKIPFVKFSQQTVRSNSTKNSNSKPKSVGSLKQFTTIKEQTECGSSLVPDKSNTNAANRRITSKLNLNDVIKSYDYNNRFEKPVKPANISKVTTLKDQSDMNARDNADIERHIEKSREEELKKLRKKTEERGKTALEREKVRRDYEMLEAKLETLTKEMQLPGSFSNIRDNISEVQLKQIENNRLRKIDACIENVIRRPVTITLPETIQQPKLKDHPNKNIHYTNEINLANIGNDSGTINSTDSCCSILLNYVDDQTKQIDKDLKSSDDSQKTVKLKELLSKLESLKKSIMYELTQAEKSKENKNIQTMFDSINDLREQREQIMLINTEKKDLEKREKELKKRESIFEKKLREFYNIKKKEPQHSIQKENQRIQDDSMHVDYVSTGSSCNSTNRNDETNDESSICIDKQVLSIKKPVEIVIKVKDATQKTPYKKKRASLIQKEMFNKKYNCQKVSTPVRTAENSESTTSTVYRSPPETIRTDFGDLVERNAIGKKDDKEYKNKKIGTEGLPVAKEDAVKKCKEKIEKEVKQLKENPRIKKLVKRPSKTSIKTKVNTPKKLSNENQKRVSIEVKKVEDKKKEPRKEEKIKFNPVLASYIQRLLGMSRESIRMLDVSTSDVDTPNSSVINMPSNNPVNAVANPEQQDRITRIQNFINDNYSFVHEIEDSMRKEESDESIRLIEEIWKKTLKHQKMKQSTGSAEPSKPILKNKTSNETQTKKVEQRSVASIALEEKKNVNKENKSPQGPTEEEKVMEKYTELTDNCTQRIAELNEMIDRVRKEKQKILEITLSSNGGGNSETEYLDFASKSKSESKSEKENKRSKKVACPVDKKENPNSKRKEKGNNKMLQNLPILSSSIPDTPNKDVNDSGERVQLEKNKLTGVSRDSGISLSRPLTAQDNRESPFDIRDKPDENHFEPFLKDIPKPSSIHITKPTIINMASISIAKNVTNATNINDENSQSIKKNKPPASISRYSPQLVEDIPHELSTILEIETPATSRLNATIKDSNVQLNHDKIAEEQEDQADKQQQEEQQIQLEHEDHQHFSIDFQRYPTFEDYAAGHGMDIEHFDADKSSRIRKLYEELFELTQGLDINPKKFPSIDSFQNHENIINDKKASSDQDSFMNISRDLVMRKFLTPKEYFQKIGATDLLDSKSFLTNTQSKSSTLKNDDDKGASSDEEFSKDWCLRKFPELKEYMAKLMLTKNHPDAQKEQASTSKSIAKEQKFESDVESLPDINAELKRRNIITESFKDQIFTSGASNVGKSIETSSDVVAKSSSSKENKNPDFFIKTTSKNYISGVQPISSSTSSNEIGKEFEQMGLKWASLMLKKQHQSQALSSSTSSSFVFQQNENKPLISVTEKSTTSHANTLAQLNSKNIKEDHQTSINTTMDGRFGKPLNLREFLTQELQKRSQNNTNSSSLTDDSIASLFLRSLLGSSATPSPRLRNDNGGSSDRQQKTSTPVLLGISGSSRKSGNSSDSNALKLFSGESRISSVHFSSQSSGSNKKNTNKNESPESERRKSQEMKN